MSPNRRESASKRFGSDANSSRICWGAISFWCASSAFQAFDAVSRLMGRKTIRGSEAGKRAAEPGLHRVVVAGLGAEGDDVVFVGVGIETRRSAVEAQARGVDAGDGERSFSGAGRIRERAG